MENLKTRVLVIAVLMVASTIFARAQEIASGVAAKSYFGVGFFQDGEDNVAFFTLGGGTLKSGDTVELATGRGSSHVYPFVVDSEIQTSTDRIEVSISEDIANELKRGGIAYLKINDEYYWMKASSMRKTKRMARKAFN